MDVNALVTMYLTPPVPWPVAAGLAIAVVVALELAYRACFQWLARLTSKTNTHLDDVLVKRMRLPAQVLLFLVGANVLFALRDIDDATYSKAVNIVELLLLAYLVIEAAETALIDYWLGERKKVQVPSVVRGLGLVVLYTVAVLSVVGSVTGVDLAPILATSTVLTVVLGLAVQDTLGNLFSGLALSLEKPFVVGDWILVDGVEGHVEQMGWRGVHLRTFTRDIVTFPNAVIAKAKVQNFSRPEKLHARNVDVLAPPNADPDVVEKAARAACAKVPAIRTEPPPRIWLIQQTPVGQKWSLNVWLDDFAIHDDTESTLRKHWVKESQAAGLELPPTIPSAPAN
jgi:small-conductance mechanosensitive channel